GGKPPAAPLRARTSDRRFVRQPSPLLCCSAARETPQSRSPTPGRLGDARLLARAARLEPRAAPAQGPRLDEPADSRGAGGAAQGGWQSVRVRERILDGARAGDRETEGPVPSAHGLAQ